MKTLSDQRGTAAFTVLIIAMLLILGVLGVDYSRAFAVQARIQTAADAATLAACAKAEVKGDRIEQMLDANGNVTNDPNQAVKIISNWSNVWLDLSNCTTQADAASWNTFFQNITKGISPIHDVAIPQQGVEIIPNMNPIYRYTAGIDYSKPKTAPDGSVYYDTYKISTLEVGVKSYLAHNLFRKHDNQDILNMPENGHWTKRTIPVKVQSSAQVILAR
ncbi:MAG: TadE/TadG family type IV pilus assembly protein [Bacillota bacterium]